MLREITAETVRAVVTLAVAEDQTKFVASNGMSLAQALFAPEAWYRAIYRDDELVGFVMLSDDSLLDPRRPPGEMEEDEVVMELELGDPAAPPLVIGDAMAHIAYVNVFVRDLDRATEFYRDTLGLQLQYASPEHGYASFAAGGVRLGIAVPGPEQTELVGRHTGVGLAVTDLEEEHVRLAGLGARFTMPPTRQPWGGFMAMVADPDGNVFYLEQVAGARA